MLENADSWLHKSEIFTNRKNRPGPEKTPAPRWQESDQPETTNIMNLQQAGDSLKQHVVQRMLEPGGMGTIRLSSVSEWSILFTLWWTNIAIENGHL